MKCPISKEVFCEAIQSIREYYSFLCKIEEFFRINFYGEDNASQKLAINYEEFLREVMRDKNEWISYYLWELDFGAKWHEGVIIEKGKDVKLLTPEDLYDFLIKCYWE